MMQSKYFKTDFFDLAPIYNIGRLHKPPKDGRVNIFRLSDKEKLDLDPFIKSLVTFLKSESSQKIKPFFIELSLYDPSDPDGKTFYSILLSNSEDSFDSYQKHMDENIEFRVKGDSDSERGIIIPNPNLYNYTFFYYPVSSKVIVPDNMENVQVRFGCFKDPENREYQAFSALRYSIELFFNDVVSSFSAMKQGYGDGPTVNSALLVPLYRPASTIDNKSINMFKGGGIFIYGATESGFNHHEFILELKTILLKSVFKQTFSQIEGEKINQRFTTIELNTFHHLRSSFQHLPKYIEDVNESVGISPNTSIKDSLTRVENYLTSFLNNSLSLLTIFKHTISDINKDGRYKVSQLQDDLYERFIKEEWLFLKSDTVTNVSSCIKLDVTGIEDSVLSKSLKVHPESLQGIILTYIQNILQAYIKKHESLNGINIFLKVRNISISVNEVLEFEIFNSGTQIPEGLLEKIGREPNASELSSGLGLYFINTMLNFVGAVKNNIEDRHFSIKNIDNGVSFSFKISI